MKKDTLFYIERDEQNVAGPYDLVQMAGLLRKKIITPETMSRLEERLDPQMFLRVHRSSIVNLQYVKEVRTDVDGECMVVLLNGQKVPMSRSYRSRIQDWLHR